MKELIAKDVVEILTCSYFKITDESSQHAGHKGVDRVGNTHFRLVIVSDKFNNQSLVQRQRAVNQICQKYFDQGLHALALKTYTQQEWRENNG